MMTKIPNLVQYTVYSTVSVFGKGAFDLVKCHNTSGHCMHQFHTVIAYSVIAGPHGNKLLY